MTWQVLLHWNTQFEGINTHTHHFTDYLIIWSYDCIKAKWKYILKGFIYVDITVTDYTDVDMPEKMFK